METRNPIVLDVLIIGGGVQGLCLLNDLRGQRYSALLVERGELGGEQTCHSHVYIHQGHLYRDAQAGLAERLRDVKALWDKWLASHVVKRGFEAGCFGFQNPSSADQKVALWAALGLPVEPMDVPIVLESGAVRRAYRTREACLDGESLVRELRSGVEAWIRSIDRVDSIVVRNGAGGRDNELVESVRVIEASRSLTFRPRALVLAAGARNQVLLDLASGGDRSLGGRVRESQQLRQSHMLVIRGMADRLPPLSGIFPDLGGLFVVSRICGDETVWLVSDDRSDPVFYIEDWIELDARRWLPRVLESLKRLAPRCFGARTLGSLQWGVYSGAKAEGRAAGVIPDQPRIDRFRTRNLWAVWPTKLTLAPKASQTICGEIGATLGPPSRAVPASAIRRLDRKPAVAVERWRKTPMMSWPDFKRCWL